MWLPPALLLLCLPGCLSLVGPRFVTGTEGDSLTIRCRYEEGYQGYNKYWCRGQYDTNCDKIVETQGTEREKRNGRVTIRDNADDLTLTVTIERLHAGDAGSYWCKIQTVWILDEWSRDPSFQVRVSVSPAPRTTTRRMATPATFPAVTAGQNFSTNHCPG
uniref:CD300e molecule n=2 Tax=Pipistrellus kuhlii TaxID=59472 RepID=A0A7J7SE19_PIPKU|nr:CD300e molecule [Pipistrellus kuhlii]